MFVGIDVIGDWLTEINVTSPTGMQEIDRFDGVSLEARIWDAIEATSRRAPPRAADVAGERRRLRGAADRRGQVDQRFRCHGERTGPRRSAGCPRCAVARPGINSLTIPKREWRSMRALGGRAGGLLHARHVVERLAPVGRRLRLAQCRRLCAQQRAHADGATAGCVDEATAGGGHRQQPRGGPLRHAVAPRGVGACRRRSGCGGRACTSRRSPTIAVESRLTCSWATR